MRRLFPLAAFSMLAASCTVGAAEPELSPAPAATADAAHSGPTATIMTSSTTTTPASSTAPTTSAPASTSPPPTSEPAPVDVDADDCAAGRSDLEIALEAPPQELSDRLAFVLASSQWAGVDRTISVWVEGYGEVVAEQPDLALLPASNQKILTAAGAALLLDDDHRFVTSVHQAGDDLLLVGGGDPTLARIGDHSLQELARQVHSAGVESIDRVIVDTAHFEDAVAAPGWLDYQMPAYVGPMSALMVDDNRYRTDDEYVADAATANGQLFAFLLAQEGIEVRGAAERGVLETDTPRLAQVESAPVSELVVAMMTNSDNEVAESLVREMGGGSTVDGLARIEQAVAEWCLGLEGVNGDGSGLGRASFRSAREWRRLLQVIDEQPWGEAFRASLAVAGRTGTLTGRFDDTAAEGAVQAKTGSIFGGRSLSGYTTTADGRDVVFSIVTNGSTDAARASRDAIDGLVVALVTPLAG
ncbi:MAG: D-alanyl-D-alanine carboxypeptidase/D-alanyl-D-alanine-endopeptidase [Acidimicrobiia bacterium]|nr:D-alanyl-D-alanine carboxypeptidase/D-alanyl-D-alanine-endopeptidase [Acidimicrobiia bacterium]